MGLPFRSTLPAAAIPQCWKDEGLGGEGNNASEEEVPFSPQKNNLQRITKKKAARASAETYPAGTRKEKARAVQKLRNIQYIDTNKTPICI